MELENKLEEKKLAGNQQQISCRQIVVSAKRFIAKPNKTRRELRDQRDLKRTIHKTFLFKGKYIPNINRGPDPIFSKFCKDHLKPKSKVPFQGIKRTPKLDAVDSLKIATQLQLSKRSYSVLNKITDTKVVSGRDATYSLRETLIPKHFEISKGVFEGPLDS